jgi:hypothetical protein
MTPPGLHGTIQMLTRR